MLQKTERPLLLLLFVLFISCTATRNMSPATALQQGKHSFPLTDTLLENLLRQHPARFGAALQNKQAWRIQVIYTQIDRDDKNKPTLRHFYYNVDPSLYFYPASTVKMPATVLALQKLNTLNIPGLTKHSSMETLPLSPRLTGAAEDSSNATGKPSLAHYIKKIFLVSDNDAYNRLYEFLGQEGLNTALHSMGYDSVQLLHRLQLPLNDEENRQTNAVRFLDSAGKLLYEQPAAVSRLAYQQRSTRLGKGYLQGGKLVEQPFDFSQKNRFTLPDLHTVLQAILFPETVAPAQRFRLQPDDYRFLHTCMSMKPAESKHPHYPATYTDAYVKFLLFGGEGPMPDPQLRIFNKVGDAYGFLQDVAYIADFANGVEFMLSATIYCNSDGIFNDDKYDYDTIGFPFLKNLGEVIYHYELNRPRMHRPDLSKFKMDYTDF